MRRVMLLIVTLAVLLPACKAAVDKPRVVVMTDIGGDPDVRQSIVRFLLYTCDFDDLPFSNIQRVVFDPSSQALVYVTTFGGSVWRGPVVPHEE